MADPVEIGTDGEVVTALVPEGYPGPYSALVRSLRQRLSGVWVDWVAVREAYRFGRGRRFPVARRAAEAAADEKAKVRLSTDGLVAYLILYPPKPQGKRLTEVELLRLVTAYGVPREIVDVQAVRMASLRRSYQDPEPIARGRAPTDGKPARLEWAAGGPTDPDGFLSALEEGRPRDYDAVLAEVAEGQRAGRYRPSEAGIPGFSAVGGTIPAHAGEDPTRLGEGLALGPDGTSVTALRAGHLRISGRSGECASVVPLLRVRDAQDLEPWRNGVFPGSVIAEGDLEVRFPLTIVGDLEVRGGLVRSSIDVLGSVFVRDGVIHQGRSPVRVGGVLSASFLDRAWVVAHTVHIRRYSLQSRILAREAILAPGEASICGGQAAARLRIAAGVLGSSGSMDTDVVVGNPSVTATFQDLYYGWAAGLRAHCTSEASPPAQMVEAVEHWERAAQELRMAELSAAHVWSHLVHPGVVVRIGSALREIGNPVGPVTFSYERIGPRDRVAMSRK